jgi:hypothetical protein
MMGDFFRQRIVDTGRLPLFCFFVAFIVTFVLTRINVRLIRGNVRWWFKNVQAGSVHIHHVVFGVVLMFLGGIAGLAIPDKYLGLYMAGAVVFGMGTALVLDEFALLLHLRDVYWREEGRASVDAVFVAVAFTGLLLLGIRPVGFDDPRVAGDLDHTALLWLLYAATLVVNLTVAMITLLKGKIWTGLAGLFVPILLYVGALRVARPGSPWARWFYRPDTRKLRRALRHEERLRRPLIRAKIWLQEFIAGQHDLGLFRYTELVAVGRVELVPPVVHRVAAANGADGVSVEEMSRHVEAQMPAGGDLGQPVPVLERVAQHEPGAGRGRGQVPAQHVVSPAVLQQRGPLGADHRRRQFFCGVAIDHRQRRRAGAGEVAVGGVGRPLRQVRRVGQRGPHLLRRVRQLADERERPALVAGVVADLGERARLEGVRLHRCSR